MLFAKLDLIFGVISEEEFDKRSLDELAIRYRLAKEALADVFIEKHLLPPFKAQIIASATYDKALLARVMRDSVV